MATFTVDERTIGFETAGEGAPVLVFHGTTQSRAAWDPVIAQVQGPRTWVKVDLPGSGESHSPEVIDLDTTIDDAVRLMDHLGHREFSVIGYSLGAVCALHTAARHSDRVDSVVSLCGWAATDARMKHTFRLWQKLLGTGAELFMHYAIVDGYTAAAVGQIDPIFDGAVAMAATTVAPGSHAQLDLDIAVDITADLALISCPALVIAGLEDRWVDVSHSRHIADTVTGAVLLELPAGHLVITEMAGEIASAISAHMG